MLVIRYLSVTSQSFAAKTSFLSTVRHVYRRVALKVAIIITQCRSKKDLLIVEEHRGRLYANVLSLRLIFLLLHHCFIQCEASTRPRRRPTYNLIEPLLREARAIALHLIRQLGHRLLQVNVEEDRDLPIDYERVAFLKFVF